jgi:hypothetical protein
MWRNYFGHRSHIYGVDIEPACTAYQTENISILIGDQSDRVFWASVKKQVPAIDVIIDDGGHAYDQQRITLEELLPHLRSGGVYLCEDVHGDTNRFSSYVHHLADDLNGGARMVENIDSFENRLLCTITAIQSAIGSIHIYPYVVVIERTDTRISEFRAPKHGTEWQPFLS